MKIYSQYINPYMEKILNNEIEHCKEQELMIKNIVIPILEREDVYIDEDKIEKAGLEFSENKVTFWMKDNRGTHFVEAGLDCWIHGKTSMTGGYLHHQYEMDEMKIAACAYWKSENVLMMEWRYPEMAFFDHVSFEWKEDRIYMKRWVNMNSQALERPVVTAKICES